MTASLVTQRLHNSGTLVITQGINDWVATGVEPWAHEPNEDTLSQHWRQHYIQVIVTSHIAGDQGDTCPEDHALNREAFDNPNTGGRIVTKWERNGAARIFCITDDYGGKHAVTTVLFASEY